MISEKCLVESENIQMAIIKNYLEKLRKVDMKKREMKKEKKNIELSVIVRLYVATCSQFVGETRHKTVEKNRGGIKKLLKFWVCVNWDFFDITPLKQWVIGASMKRIYLMSRCDLIENLIFNEKNTFAD